MADQQFCLRWNNHQSTLISVFDSLLENGTLVDCTLAAEGQYLKAHKVVLSACSPYLEALLSQHYEKHPIVILKDVKFTELKSMMDYMYRGEVNISQDQLGTFLKAAESLQIKGLSDNGSDGDGRDVGSTSKGPPGKVQPAPSNRPAESQRPELSPPSSVHRSRDGSISPSSRKRRRIRRNSQGDDANMGDSHLDSNSCDLPNQAQSTPLVPNIPATVTSSISATPIKATIVKPEQTELVNRIDSSNLNSLPPESGLLKEKIEPISEPLLEPKTEYLDETNNDDSVEDLTLDDDDEMDEMDISNMSNMSNISRPGPSHGNDVSQMSNQGFVPWQIGNQSGTDEVFMAAQEAVQAHRNDSQEPQLGEVEEKFLMKLGETKPSLPIERFGDSIPPNIVEKIQQQGIFPAGMVEKMMNEKVIDRYRLETPAFCSKCGKSYYRKDALQRHMKECGRIPPLACTLCPYRTFRKDNLMRHSMKHMKSIAEHDPEAPKALFPFAPQDLLQPPTHDSREKTEEEPEADEPETTLEERSDEETSGPSDDHSPDQDKMIDRRRLDNPIGCSTCGKVYYWKGALRRHMKECGRDPPMVCTYCNYRTFRKDNLLSHLFRKHNVLQN